MSKDKSKAFNSGAKRPRNIGVMIGSIIVLIITVIAFIFVPAMSQSASSNDELIFGYYGDSKIDYVPGNYFARQIEYINNVYRDTDTFSDNIEYKRQLVWQTAFNQTVIQKAIESVMDKSGFTVSDKQIDIAMVERGPFQVDGKFNEELYKSTSNQRKFELRGQFEEDLIREQYMNDVMYGVYRNDGLLDFISTLGTNEKSFNYAVFNIDTMEDEFFSTYGSANIDQFTKASLNKISIYSSKDDADALYQKISSGELSFKDAAIAESDDSFAADGGNAGEMYFHELLSDVEAEDSARAVFALKDNEVSEVIETSYGWIMFQMINAPILPDTSTEELINDIKVYMSRNEKGMIEDSLVAKGQEFTTALSDESNFLNIASEMGIENDTTGYFTVNYGNNRMIPSNITNATSQNPAFSSAAYDELFLERLFTLDEVGNVSDPLVLGNNIIVAQLAGEKESDLIPEESLEFYKYQVESEVSSYMQADLQNMVLGSEDFTNDFIMTYAEIFYAN